MASTRTEEKSRSSEVRKENEKRCLTERLHLHKNSESHDPYVSC